jgi:Fic family protein
MKLEYGLLHGVHRMKTPMPPPAWEAVLANIQRDGGRMLRVIQTRGPRDDVEYLPWDEIRFRTPPDDLTLEEWWAAIRIARNGMQRPLPLRDVRGKQFSYAIPDTVLQRLDEISQRASGQIAASEEVTNPATRHRYVVSSLIEEAITSSQLEGASTSRRVAKDMIRSGREPRDKSERMIFNNYRAMQYVASNHERPLTPETVCELHRIVTDGTLRDPESAGRIQSNPDPSDRVAVFDEDNRILHSPPPVGELEERLQELCNFANGESDAGTWVPPVVRALAIHFMFGYDHYFEDGNGRTARALFYWSMLHEGYWLTEYLTISRILKQAPTKYSRSFMHVEVDSSDLTYFLIYHLKVIHRALDDLDEYLTRKVKELKETRLLLSSAPGGEYNHRQLALLESALKDSAQIFTMASHAQSHQVALETARQDLRRLQSRGLLARTKIGRKFAWQAAPDLTDLLKARRDPAVDLGFRWRARRDSNPQPSDP